MISIIFHIFLFSTWGLGLAAFVSFMGQWLSDREIKREILKLDLKRKNYFFENFSTENPNASNLFNSLMTGEDFLKSIKTNFPQGDESQIPEKVKEFMAMSKDHPEVEEIDGTDEILGVRFESENYPPGFDEDD